MPSPCERRVLLDGRTRPSLQELGTKCLIPAILGTNRSAFQAVLDVNRCKVPPCGTVLVVVYDREMVPYGRRHTGRPRGTSRAAICSARLAQGPHLAEIGSQERAGTARSERTSLRAG